MLKPHEIDRIVHAFNKFYHQNNWHNSRQGNVQSFLAKIIAIPVTTATSNTKKNKKKKKKQNLADITIKSRLKLWPGSPKLVSFWKLHTYIHIYIHMYVHIIDRKLHYKRHWHTDTQIKTTSLAWSNGKCSHGAGTVGRKQFASVR